MSREEQDGKQTEIVPAIGQIWNQQPGETAKAFEGFRAYRELGPAKRSIANAYRVVKGKPESEQVKVPGYFGSWSSQHNWHERTHAWDLHFEALLVVADIGELQDARRQTVEQAKRIQALKRRIYQGADALYFRLDDSPIVKSEEVAAGVVLDYDKNNQVVGVVMFRLSRRAPFLNFSTLELVTT